MGEIPNFTDSERLKTPKTDCVLKFTKTKNSISLDSRFVDLANTGFPATLRLSCQGSSWSGYQAGMFDGGVEGSLSLGHCQFLFPHFFLFISSLWLWLRLRSDCQVWSMLISECYTPHALRSSPSPPLHYPPYFPAPGHLGRLWCG